MDDRVVETAQFYQDVRPLVTCSQETSPNQKLVPFPSRQNVPVFIVLLPFSDVMIERSSFMVRLATIWV